MKLAGIKYIPVKDWTEESSANKNIFALFKIGCEHCCKDCEIESSKFEKKTIKEDSYTWNLYFCSECFLKIKKYWGK